MQQLPGGLWYEPADLGFNNLLIPAGTVVNGNIVPWAAAFRLRSVGIFFEIVSGTASGFTLSVRGLDIDGQGVLLATNAIWTAIVTDAASYWFNGAPTDTAGVTAIADVPRLLLPPYLRFSILNEDGANDGNVSLRALLSP